MCVLRSNPLAVRLLQRASPSLSTRLINKMMGNDGSKVLWYFYFLNAAACYIVYGLVLAPVIGTMAQHYAYYVAAGAMQLSYFFAHTVSPGGVPKGSAKASKLYEEALQAAADGTYADASSMPALCHTCRIVKPMRSKHCTVLKRCVPMFDHYCPYINNTIGGGNYFAFVRFIFLGLVSAFLSVAGAVQYLLVVTMRNGLVWFFLVDMSMVLLMAVLMNSMHMQPPTPLV